MAQVISQQFGPAASSALADWLLRLEALRYAPAGRASQDLAVLQREFKQLSWPPPVPAARTAGTASLT
jgi:hypothetical protein